jgi:hypothetical protein
VDMVDPLEEGEAEPTAPARATPRSPQESAQNALRSSSRVRQQRTRICEVFLAECAPRDICSGNGGGLHRGTIRRVPPRSPTCSRTNSGKCTAGLGCEKQILTSLCTYFI